jgi:hypothetical protein
MTNPSLTCHPDRSVGAICQRGVEGSRHNLRGLPEPPPPDPCSLISDVFSIALYCHSPAQLSMFALLAHAYLYDISRYDIFTRSPQSVLLL